jgi:hypothetical protein
LWKAVPVIACGGWSDGLALKDETISEIRLPESLAVFQIVENYGLFRALGLDAERPFGAFSLFSKRRSSRWAGIGPGTSRRHGTDHQAPQASNREQKAYKIKFVSDPICWTEMPETLTMLGRQRRR